MILTSSCADNTSHDAVLNAASCPCCPPRNSVALLQARDAVTQGNGSSTWMQRCCEGTQTLTVPSLDDEMMCLQSLCSATISATCTSAASGFGRMLERKRRGKHRLQLLHVHGRAFPQPLSIDTCRQLQRAAARHPPGRRRQRPGGCTCCTPPRRSQSRREAARRSGPTASRSRRRCPWRWCLTF